MIHSSMRLAPLALLLPLAAGCGLVNTAAETSEGVVRAIVPGGAETPPKPVEDLQADIFRYADRVVMREEEATRRFAEAAATPEAQLQAARWRLEGLRWTTQIATGENSLLSLLDLTNNAARIARRWCEARARFRDELTTIEGAGMFEGVQRFLEIVHRLSSERRLARIAYWVEKPGPRSARKRIV